MTVSPTTSLPQVAPLGSFKPVHSARNFPALLPVASDIGRVVAATAILYYHIGPSTRFPLAAYGEFAVTFFILLAGGSYVCFSRASVENSRGYWNLLRHRFWTIFPTYAVVNAGLYLLSFVYPSASGRPFTMMEFVLSTVGVSQYFGFVYESSVMWFFPFILQVYMLL